jgi:diaminopimelate decarboxylase
LYHQDILLSQFRQLRRALPQVIEIYYSIKANPHPKLAEIFIKQGAGCEIASGGEYVRARQAGAPPERIIFAGPAKGREELEYVVAHGIGEIHVESFEELELLDQVAAAFEKSVDVAIRINPSSVCGGGLLMGGQATAFGFEEESLGEVLRTLSSRVRLRLRGVHLYAGTQILDAEVLLRHWQHALAVANKVCQHLATPITTIDFGGGLGIPYFPHETQLNLEALSRGAAKLMKQVRADERLKAVRFILEPGRFLVGPAGIYVARIRSVKICRGTTFVVLDGGMNHHLAASGNLGQVIRRDYPIVNCSRHEPGTESPVVVVGPLCTPIDTLGRKVNLCSPKAGDLIGILQSGAYGLSASPLYFLSHPTPAEVLVRQGEFETITPRQSPFETHQGSCAAVVPILR